MHSWWDGTFLWSDETPLDYTNWDTNEPNGQVLNITLISWLY